MVFKVRGGVVKIIENLTKVFFFFGEGVEVGRMYVREFLYIFKIFDLVVELKLEVVID